MKRMMTMLALAVCLFAIAGCAGYRIEQARDKGIVVMFGPYREAAPWKGILGVKGAQYRIYYTGAYFKNRETKEKVWVGGIKYQYGTSNLEPGHYDLAEWFIGGIKVPYDGGKCGNISFDIGPHDLLVFKALKPLAISDRKTIFGNSIRNYAYAAFANIPEDYLHIVRKNYANLPGFLDDRHIRLVDLRSSNPAAFDSCVREAGSKYKTLLAEPGAIVVPAFP